MEYSIDTKIRLIIYFWLATGSIIFNFMIVEYFSKESFIITVSSFTIFGILIFIFDKFIWNCNALSRTPTIPDFNGTWHGFYVSNDAPKKQERCYVEIEQSFTRFTATFYKTDETDISYSTSVSMTGVGTKSIRLGWAYNKEGGADKTRWGYNKFTHKLNKNKERVLIGFYITDTPSSGSIELTLKKK